MRKEYTVLPSFLLKMAGPKPMPNSGTRTPTALAVSMWPSSWMTMRKMRPRMPRTKVTLGCPPSGARPLAWPRRPRREWIPSCSSGRSRARLPGPPRRPTARRRAPGLSPGPGVHGGNGFHAVHRAEVGHGFQNLLDSVRYREELYPAVEEGLDGHLVGGVQGGGVGPAGLPGVDRERQAPEDVAARLLEGPRGAVERHGGGADVHPLGVEDAVGDGETHVREGGVEDHGAVHEHRAAVYYRLSVHDHPHGVVTDAEEVVGLYHLKALVHHRGRVYGDLGPHLPGRVREGVAGADPRELLSAGGDEGPARGGQAAAGPARQP